MIKTRLILLPLLGSLAVLTGCAAVGGGSCLKPPDAEDAEDRQPLRIPVGLDAPDTRAAMKIPPLEQPAVAAPRTGCLEDPPQIVNLLPPTESDREKSKASTKSGKSGRTKRPPGKPGL